MRRDAGVVAVLANSNIPMPTVPNFSVHETTTGAHSTVRPHVLPGVCGTAAHPQLDPEALSNINAEAAIHSGADGAGVSVAFIADGLDTTVPDFQRNAAFASAGNPAGHPVITSYQDFSGDGTAAATPGGEAFLDASSIAAQGNSVYDLSGFVNAAHPLPAGCDIKVQGDAPGADVYALKVFSNTFTTTSAFIQAIDYAVSHGVKVINESFGSNPFPDSSLDATKLADDAAVAAGVTVVVSSGDAGISSTIGSPSDDPNLISVGATTTFRSYQQDTYGGINAPGIGNGKVIDNNISSLSSGGFAQDGKTVDLVAPGDLNWALCSASVSYPDCGGATLELSGGTSESSPLTAGAAADVIQAYAATHHHTYPSPALVKHILTSSATDVLAPGDQQGAGILNVGAAVDLARSIVNTTDAHRPGGLLANKSQLDLTGLPNTNVTTTVKLTNTGTHGVTVKPVIRQLVKSSQVTGSVTMDPSTPATQPMFPIWSGFEETYQTSKFVVPAHTDRLKFEAAWTYTQQTSVLHVALFGPDKYYAAYSLPQGTGDYSEVEVAAPKAGKWTAVFFTEYDGDAATAKGTSGLVPYNASFWKYEQTGTASPNSLHIGAGQTKTVTVKLHTPSNPGDTVASLEAGTISIPITLRTQIKIGSSGGSFAGVLTGGNGRGGEPAKTNTYTFKVPSGKKDLDASIVMGSNLPGGLLPGDQFNGMLVDPTGQIQAYNTNYTNGGVNPYLQLYANHPAAGKWELVIDWAQPTMGVADSVGFRGAVRFNLVSTGSALPDSALTYVNTTGGTYNVTVTNTGVAPMILSTDARLPTSANYTLSDFLSSSLTQNLPGGNNTFFVPTHSSALSVAQSSSLPATFDVSTYPGDPDISPQTGGTDVATTLTSSTASITYTPPTQVTPALWFDADSEIGPYGTGPAPAGTETTDASVTALAFDTAVSSSTGDAVQHFTTGGGGFSPILVNPGTSAVIAITITPTASLGTTVSGTLFVDDFTEGQYDPGGTLAFATVFTSDIAAIPYEYTVGSPS
ncbi:MAG TPA: S8 family serine peptidase [Acidimicrobiales bacterium]|nr:S8 family serine peptidase [Acidimicrobiales bacterium]